MISNGDFDHYWGYHLAQEHQRLYPGTTQGQSLRVILPLTPNEPHPTAIGVPEGRLVVSRCVIASGLGLGDSAIPARLDLGRATGPRPFGYLGSCALRSAARIAAAGSPRW